MVVFVIVINLLVCDTLNRPSLFSPWKIPVYLSIYTAHASIHFIRFAAAIFISYINLVVI